MPKPAWAPDEQFHRAITESLEEWWREQGGRFEAVTVIGEEPSVRTHEIRDILARNSVPFGFYRSDSAEGRQALARLGVDQPAGPVVALFNNTVLVNPGNAEVAEALGGQRAAGLPGLRRDNRGSRAGRPGRRGVCGLGGPDHRGAGAGGVRRPGRDELPDPDYLGFPSGISGTELAWRAGPSRCQPRRCSS